MEPKSEARIDRVPLKRVDREAQDDSRVVNAVDRLPVRPLQMAKAKVGAAIAHAIGTKSPKEFGDAGLVCNVTSGRKVPDYLARLYLDEGARRRLALALLHGTNVRKRIVIDWDEEEEAC